MKTTKTKILTVILALLSFPLRAAIIDGPTTAIIQVSAGVVAEEAGGSEFNSQTASNNSPMNVSTFISNGLGSASSSGTFSYSFTNTSFSESAQFDATLDGWTSAFGATSSTWHFSITNPTTFSLSGFAIGDVGLSLIQDGTLTHVYHYDSTTDGDTISGTVLLQPADYTFQSDSLSSVWNDDPSVGGLAIYSFDASLRDAGGPPSLNIGRSNAFVIVSWPVMSLNFQLQESTNLSLPNAWSPVAQPAVTNAGQMSVTIPAPVGSKFFRLKSP